MFDLKFKKTLSRCSSEGERLAEVLGISTLDDRYLNNAQGKLKQIREQIRKEQFYDDMSSTTSVFETIFYHGLFVGYARSLGFQLSKIENIKTVLTGRSIVYYYKSQGTLILNELFGYRNLFRQNKYPDIDLIYSVYYSGIEHGCTLAKNPRLTERQFISK